MKIVFLEPLGIAQENLQNRVESVVEAGHEIVYYNNRKEDVATLIERSKDADVVVFSNFKYPKEVISACKNLKMICVAFTGVDHVDVAYCKECGITVCNCAGYSTVAVADVVFGMVISLARNFVACNEVCRKEGTKDGLVGFELEGKKFGIIGAGAIGLRVANIAKAFGCEVYAYSRTQKDVEGVQFVSKEELLSTCDIVSLHVPQNAETLALIGEAELDLMKPTAMLINTARGPVVDSEALAKALHSGKIAAAGVDVFEIEPPIASTHPLFGAPNVLVTPHIAFATHQAFEKRADIVGDNIQKWLEYTPINVIV
ncbi:2-hydroxyacid dehydrogenase [Chakrabartyella piscis]|uniref:2-hydroxyacid dehydrogenase n=1 Tax=Chakrabartyella piscis TaxID=2918914 RepID=UPI002958C04F|nr:2-hydroxyacid dehydrogenase [Chakrabartyella piscis]